MGMADGRCLTFNISNRQLVDGLMAKAGLAPENNSKFRELLQQQGPDFLPLQADDKCLKPWMLNPVDG